MNIVLGSSLYAPYAVGGAEKVVEALALRLIELGNRVSVITTQPRGAPAHRQVNGVSVHYVPVANVYRPFGDSRPGQVRKAIWRAFDSYNWRMRSPIADILDQEKPDVVNTHNISGLSVAMWSVVYQRKIPLIHTLHDQYLVCHRSTMFKKGRNCTQPCIDCRLLAAPRKRASHLVDAVIGVSRFILQRHIDYGYFDRADLAVIYNTGLDEIPPTIGPRQVFKRPRFGFLGQIIPTKGLELLIDSFQRLSHLDAELIIAGRGDETYETALRDRSAADQRIRWLGYVDPEELFAKVDFLVVPSVWHDTAPLVVLEAFRRGVPVLGSNVGGIPELLAPGTGWIFSHENQDDLDRAIIECSAMIDSYPSTSAKCVELAKERAALTWGESYVKAYKAAMTRRHGRVAAS